MATRPLRDTGEWTWRKKTSAYEDSLGGVYRILCGDRTMGAGMDLGDRGGRFFVDVFPPISDQNEYTTVALCRDGRRNHPNGLEHTWCSPPCWAMPTVHREKVE